ncbi:DNA alkylation repair protein [Sphingobacterium sp. DR205]|uniref:DNA alkylation repair protein n=1 Tax=Sphingobacterium sp. DR205 TaxID=2713573 RepID=UPI0013E4F964|nr:DNA alkylation repair protein [Sphingobacterium sp. DR205]QIH33944.1 DNA alkylation repair protein [Sphingobacterium sp. DR205]
MSLIKDIYSISFYQQLADQFSGIKPDFDGKQFIKRIFSTNFNDLEWKERTKHSTQTLHEFMPPDFEEAVELINQVVKNFIATGHSAGLEYIIFPDYIETYGIDHFELAVQSFELVTTFITCEFAVRPFIIKYRERMIAVMEKWAESPHTAVRRLASEGIRPRLPWAMAIPFLKQDPAPILPILNLLKNDVSESVRRSVANNLNDISKDHPVILLDIARHWKGISRDTDAIIKHASRTLLKRGHPDILHYYGLDATDFKITDLYIETPVVKIGGQVSFSFQIENAQPQPKALRLEYGLYYQKSNGLLSRKVFKISERIYQGSEINRIQRNQSFKVITTRKFYTGRHKISIIVNGEETLMTDFELI